MENDLILTSENTEENKAVPKKKRAPLHDKVVFKDYSQNVLPLQLDLNTMIPDNHAVRIVNRAIDNIDLKPLLAKYSGGGTSSYHPVMMLKLLIYAYVDKIYSSRRIEKATRENINYMWLCGFLTPDFKTINNFRGQRMKDVLEKVFYEIVDVLIQEGYVKLENYFLDGTKIEANASKYSWVWGKSTKRYKEKLREKCKELFVKIDKINIEEEENYGSDNLEEYGSGKQIDSKVLKELDERIDEKLKYNPKDRELKKAQKLIEKDYLPRMEKYETQEVILAERNSYAKTDTDATFMRMKEDHMRNGQLKPGYNVQMGTENQFIVGYSIHQTTSDSIYMTNHLEQLKTGLNGKLPQNIVADAGYGSEQNYEYLNDNRLGNYVKYNTFHKEATKKWKSDPTRVQNWLYLETTDEYVCGYGRYFSYQYEKKQRSATGFESLVRVYESESCDDCPHREKCLKQIKRPDAHRRIYINRRWNALKAQTNTNLTGDYGKKMRSLRPVEVESVFGDVKGNFGVRRFLLRGLKKVAVEWGLYSIAHNMRKMAATTA